MKDIAYKKGLIRVNKTNYKGIDFIDVRKYYQDPETEEWRPTRKGIAIPLEKVDETVKAIQEENAKK